MRKLLTLSATALAATTYLTNVAAADEIRVPNLQTEQEFFDSMPVTGGFGALRPDI